MRGTITEIKKYAQNHNSTNEFPYRVIVEIHLFVFFSGYLKNLMGKSCGNN